MPSVMPSVPTSNRCNRARSKSTTRPPSSSSLSSTDPSYPSTPQDAAFPNFLAQINPNLVCEDFLSQNHRDFSGGAHFSEDPTRGSTQVPQNEGTKFTDIFHIHSQTITSTTVSRAIHRETLERMHIPFPAHDQGDLTYSPLGPDPAPAYDDEFGGTPVRHPLRNRVNSKSGGASFTDGDNVGASPTKHQRVRAQTHRLESHSTASTPDAASGQRASASLRMKQKKTYSQRGAMNLFKSLSSSPQWTQAPELDDIEFDWGAQRREKLERRMKDLDQETDQEHSAHIRSDDVVDIATQRRSWELTPEERIIRRQLEAEDTKKFIFKDRIWLNSSYVSPHSKDTAPYPLAYDKVNLQADRHSHELLKQIFAGRPSIHDDISQRNPVTVLDLGCGDGSWILDAAQSWKNTRFYGLDLQDLHPSAAQLAAELGEQAAENIRFTYFNFLNDQLPYLDDKFNMVRMAHLKWAIPEDKWDFLLAEVHRVLKRGGWVEIIDDDFVLPTSPETTLSTDQLALFDELETRFKDMLRDRSIPLNIPSKFMIDKLGSHYIACHEEDFVVAMSKARPVSVDMHGQCAVPNSLMSEGVSHKSAKILGIGFEDKHFSSAKSTSRSRSGSIGSAASHSTRDDSSVRSQSMGDHEDSYPDSIRESPKQRVYEPLGLIVHPGRFIPFPPNELNAHAIRNMQNILACKEAIRAHEQKKSLELASLEVKDELLLEEKRRFERLSCEWDEQRRAFDDAFWDFESAMLKRLCLPQRLFDIDDDEDLSKPPNGGLWPQSSRTSSGRSKSHRGSDVSLSSSTASTLSMASTISLPSPTVSTCSLGPSIPVRFIRVYSGWK